MIKELLAMEDANIPFFHVDIASEVLSRLSAKDLSSSKCVSKGWNSFISSPSFLCILSKRLEGEGPSGLFFQRFKDNVDCVSRPITFIPIHKNRSFIQNKILNFLPEEVVIMSSCNGLLCCRSCIHPIDDIYRRVRNREAKELVIYICNPMTKEWIALKPEGCVVGDSIGLAFYPFGSSLNTRPIFKLVSIQQSKEDPHLYSFAVYSSQTGSWTTSKEVCHCRYQIYKNNKVFVGKMFNWLTQNHHILSFDVERELSKVIKLPGEASSSLTLGCSEGYLHYVCVHGEDFSVWMLKDYASSKWVLKYQVTLVDICQESYTDLTHCNVKRRLLLAFHEDFLFMPMDRCLYSYNFRSRKLQQLCYISMLQDLILSNPTVIPYLISLTAAGVFKEDQSDENKSSEDPRDVSSLKISKRKRTC